jgi:MFS family permease
MIGAILGVAFLGFAFTIAIGSPLLDKIGMGRLLGLSGVCFIGGTLIVIFAGSLAQGRRHLQGPVGWHVAKRNWMGAGRNGDQSLNRDPLSG